jgi:hypothetical protein
VPGQGVALADVGVLEDGLPEDGDVLLTLLGPRGVLGGGVEALCPRLA